MWRRSQQYVVLQIHRFDVFVLLLTGETFTQTVWGPLCFATAVSIARGGGLRYPLQIIVCIAHLYGVALYYSTCYVNEKYKGLVYSRPEFLYFWVYYAGFNAPWVVVPAGMSCRAHPLLRREAAASY